MENFNNRDHQVENFYEKNYVEPKEFRRLKRVAAVLTLFFAGNIVVGANNEFNSVGTHYEGLTQNVQKSNNDLALGLVGASASAAFLVVLVNEEKRKRQDSENRQ